MGSAQSALDSAVSSHALPRISFLRMHFLPRHFVRLRICLIVNSQWARAERAIDATQANSHARLRGGLLMRRRPKISLVHRRCGRTCFSVGGHTCIRVTWSMLEIVGGQRQWLCRLDTLGGCVCAW